MKGCPHNEGREARRAGKVVTDNPYIGYCEVSANLWAIGFHNYFNYNKQK